MSSRETRVVVVFENGNRASDALRQFSVERTGSHGYVFRDIQYTPDHRIAKLTARDGVTYHVPTQHILMARVEEVVR